MDFAGYTWDVGVIASFFAAGAAWYAARKARDSSDRANNISEKNVAASVELQIIQFRQEWINDLRSELVEFITVILMGDNTNSSLLKLSSHHMAINLMLNETDDYVKELQEQLTILALRKARKVAKVIDGPILDINDDLATKLKDKTTFSANEFQRLARLILKNEWERLKRDVKRYNA